MHRSQWKLDRPFSCSFCVFFFWEGAFVVFQNKENCADSKPWQSKYFLNYNDHNKLHLEYAVDGHNYINTCKTVIQSNKIALQKPNFYVADLKKNPIAYCKLQFSISNNNITSQQTSLRIVYKMYRHLYCRTVYIRIYSIYFISYASIGDRPLLYHNLIQWQCLNHPDTRCYGDNWLCSMFVSQSLRWLGV